jgi:predicted dehydrogenase
MNPRQPGWNDVTWQLRNWRYFCWLSGDFVTCDMTTTVDNMLWLMGGDDGPAPVKVTAAGGRVQRTDPAYGNIYDHFSATLEWPNGQRRGNLACRQWVNADQRDGVRAFGTKGTAELYPPRITGANAWSEKVTGRANMFDLEQKALLDAVRSGQPINDGERLVRATAVALMIRMSAYTGKAVFWDHASVAAFKAPADAPVIWESTLDFTPAQYRFGPMPVAPVPVPGEAAFV